MVFNYGVIPLIVNHGLQQQKRSSNIYVTRLASDTKPRDRYFEGYKTKPYFEKTPSTIKHYFELLDERFYEGK